MDDLSPPSKNLFREKQIQNLVDAIYPILYPIEQQDCKIQARHYAKVEALARQLLQDFELDCELEDFVRSHQ